MRRDDKDGQQVTPADERGEAQDVAQLAQHPDRRIAPGEDVQPDDRAALEAQIRAEMEAEFETRLAARTGNRDQEARLAELREKREQDSLSERERLELALLEDGGSIIHNGTVYASVDDLPRGFDGTFDQPAPALDPAGQAKATKKGGGK